MKNSVPVDYIIVGQGLAGSAVAMQLIRRGRRILMIDEASKDQSSRIAAGLFNPITGKKQVKTWLADTLFPYLHQYYTELETLTGKKFFHITPLYKPFASIEEQNDWMAKSADQNYQPYIRSIHTVSPYEKFLNDPFGGLELKQTGYLDTNTYLNAVRDVIRSEAVFEEGWWNEDRLKIEHEYLSYGEFRADKIIFCQGESSIRNKWFGKFIIPVKGEVLTIKSEWEKDVIINRGVYMVPGSASGESRIGSTYDYHNFSPGITEEARNVLEGKLKVLIRFPYEVLGQQWGIRPTTYDRRPVLGHHPESERLIIFNGLGTKGVSLAPYFSEVLIRWLENSGPLNKEVDVTRYN